MSLDLRLTSVVPSRIAQGELCPDDNEYLIRRWPRGRAFSISGTCAGRPMSRKIRRRRQVRPPISGGLVLPETIGGKSMPSRRTAPLPPHWERTRRRILRRDGGVCWVCRKPGADEVDHVKPASQGGGDEDTNLAAIHSVPCHRAKTAQEANAAKPKRKRPKTGKHPGDLSGAAGKL